MYLSCVARREGEGRIELRASQWLWSHLSRLLSLTVSPRRRADNAVSGIGICCSRLWRLVCWFFAFATTRRLVGWVLKVPPVLYGDPPLFGCDILLEVVLLAFEGFGGLLIAIVRQGLVHVWGLAVSAFRVVVSLADRLF